MSDLRYEIKFVLNEKALADFLRWMFVETRIKKKFPDRIVNSIYFDDMEYSSVRDNLSGIPDRRKSRLRWYLSEEKNMVSQPVLEEKIREGRLGNKNSIHLRAFKDDIDKMPLSKVLAILRSEIPLDHYLSGYHFSPALHVSYSRKYFEDASGLRITIDQKIRFRSNFSYSNSLQSYPGQHYGSKVVELKFPRKLKNSVTDMIRPLRLYPVRHSKYLAGMAMFGQVNYL